MTKTTTTTTAAKSVKLSEIARENIVAKLRSLNGKYAGIQFVRAAAKCLTCNKANKAWNSLDKCPRCGDDLSKTRTSTVQLGVTNPSHCTKPGQGKYQGVGFNEALASGNLKFFDPSANGRGGYRTAKIANITSLKVGGEVFRVK